MKNVLFAALLIFFGASVKAEAQGNPLIFSATGKHRNLDSAEARARNDAVAQFSKLIKSELKSCGLEADSAYFFSLGSEQEFFGERKGKSGLVEVRIELTLSDSDHVRFLKLAVDSVPRKILQDPASACPLKKYGQR